MKIENAPKLEDLLAYEKAAGKHAAWVYFSKDWFVDRHFPTIAATWIRAHGWRSVESALHAGEVLPGSG